jgi:hypothetical protein
MAPISRTASYTTSMRATEVSEKAQAWFAPVPIRIVANTADRVEITTGSQAKMRLLGGAFIASTSLPTRTVLTMVESGTGTQVTVTADDAVGFGVKTGMNGKYQQWLGEIVEGIQAATT